MQQSNLSVYQAKLLPNLMIVLGLGIVVIAICLDLLRSSGPQGLGPNQLSLALAGFTLLMTGVVLVSTGGRRQMGEWILIGVGATAVAFAADLIVISGLPRFWVKHILLASVAIGLLVTGVIPQSLFLHWQVGEWWQVISQDKTKLVKFCSVAVQLGLLVLIIRLFQVENQAFYNNVILVVFYGFLLHCFLPIHYGLPFFLFLSVTAILGIFGLLNGALMIGIGLLLIAITHLPVSFRARTALLLATGALLVTLRSEIVPTAISGVIWPILGSMFMFRLIVYMYDLKHSKNTPDFTSTLAYFFLIPNVVFPLFPVVDYSTFRRTYYDQDQFCIYQKGVNLMFRGVLQLILYRIVNYYLVTAPQEVTDIGDLVRFIVSNFLLILQVTGQFDLIVGMLHLFGFNLPEINHRIFLASSFTDFWRRANIYWKDFILKVCYYPAYFRMKKLGNTTRIVIATLLAFFVTWFFHAYQWFWLRGSILLSDSDIAWWAIFGLLVLSSTLYETYRGRKRSLSKRSLSWRDLVLKSLGTITTFGTISLLWSLWTSPSISEWLSLLGAGSNLTLNPASLGLIFLVIGLLIGAKTLSIISGTDDPGRQLQPDFFKSALVTGLSIFVVFLIGQPAISSLLGSKTHQILADVKVARLSDRDTKLLLRGYYEDLIGVNRFNSELWEVYTKRPNDWPLLQETEVAQLTDDFQVLRLIPSRSIVFHGARFSSNRWGMRDRDYDKIPPAKTYRIALLGPSFVMGSGVADQEVFDELLENRLTHDHGGQTFDKYEILNFGAPGYAAIQELFAFEHQALDFRPNAVLVVSHPLEKEMVVRNLADRVRRGKDIPYDRLVEIAIQAGIEKGMTQSEAEQRLKPFKDEIILWTFRKIVTSAKERGVFPLLVFMPILELSRPAQGSQELMRLAKEAGFAVLDLSEMFEKQDTNALIVAEWDRHPNAKGHQLIADRLYQAILQSDIAQHLGLSPAINNPCHGFPRQWVVFP
jgi:hypothetical protein